MFRDGGPMSASYEDNGTVDFGQPPKFPKDNILVKLPEVKGMAAGQYKTGSIIHGSAVGRTIGDFGRKSGGAGALGLNSVPTMLRAPNAGLNNIARKLDTAKNYAGIARRKSAARAFKVNRTPRSGYPKIQS